MLGVQSNYRIFLKNQFCWTITTTKHLLLHIIQFFSQTRLLYHNIENYVICIVQGNETYIRQQYALKVVKFISW